MKNPFCDEATQSVWFRNHGKVDFTYEITKTKIIIKTEKAEFCINRRNGTAIYAKIGDMESSCDNSENLKGTARTLDQAHGAIPLKDGVISCDGAAVFDDSKSLLMCKRRRSQTALRERTRYLCVCIRHRLYRCGQCSYKLRARCRLVPRFALR